MTLSRLQKNAADVRLRLGLDNLGGVFIPLCLGHRSPPMPASAYVPHRHLSDVWGAPADPQHQLNEDKDRLNYKSRKTPTIRQNFFPNGR